VKVEAINISQPGWGIQNMEGYLAHIGVHDSDLVVWVISTVDFRRRKNTIEDLQFLTSEPPLRILCLCRFASNFVENVVRRTLRSSSLERVEEETAGTLDRNLGALRRGLSLLQAQGRSQIVIFVPTETASSFASEDLARYQHVVHSIGVPALDLRDPFQHGEGRFFYDGVHLSTAGHALVAQALTKALRDLNERSAAASGSVTEHEHTRHIGLLSR